MGKGVKREPSNDVTGHYITRLSFQLLLGASLLAFAGCGPASDKNAKPAGTNAVAPAGEAKTNAAASKMSAAAALKRAPRSDAAVTNAHTVVRQPPGSPAIETKGRPVATNAGPAAARIATGTNAPAKGGISDKLRQWQNEPTFYPTVGVICLCLCLTGVLVMRLLKAKAGKASAASGPATPARPVGRKPGKITVNSCNVLQVLPQSRHLWQFDSRGQRFVLNREQTSFATEALPAGLIAKDWRQLYQRKLNVAWLPPEKVYLRVIQLPVASFDETLSMVELQLEKLSPFPLTQIVWSFHILTQAQGELQTVIVMMASRNDVEEFLGQLEGQGYLADRLDLPLLDQLQTTPITTDGAWIYPEASEGSTTALVAWWYGGVLQNLGLVTLPATDRSQGLREQLVQMAWAGEMEGWLTAPPTWHLVAHPPVAAQWEPAMREGMEQSVQVIDPVSPAGLAALTATRAAQAGPQANLLPAEYATRYHQQFVDRLWMRGLGAVLGLYLLGLLVYFGRLQVELYRTNSVEQTMAEQGPIYTNALKDKAMFQVLKDRQDLKFAALDCWKAVAELLPDGVTLEGYTFSDGRKLTLSGKAPSDQTKRLLDFDADIRKVASGGQPLFDPNAGDHVTWDTRGAEVYWHCVLELKRTEAL